jgi:hypothetical protein
MSLENKPNPLEQTRKAEEASTKEQTKASFWRSTQYDELSKEQVELLKECALTIEEKNMPVVGNVGKVIRGTIEGGQTIRITINNIGEAIDASVDNIPVSSKEKAEALLSKYKVIAEFLSKDSERAERSKIEEIK